MPIAKVYVPENVLTPEQRREIVAGLHEVLNQVEKRPLGAPTYVLIQEVPGASWGYTGKVGKP
jgi:4-oxalocrotonate tautomerase family enzyme